MAYGSVSGVYLLLGQKSQGQMGDKETNRPQTAKSLYADVVELVQGKKDKGSHLNY